MQPRSWSAPSAGAPPLADLDPPNKSEPEWTVLMWDGRQSRLQLINRIACECGAQPRWVEGLPAIPQVEFSRRCNLAVVALGSCPSPGDPCLEGIRSLKRKGFRIICYEEGVQSWPLSLRCQVLLAGASWLLDSAKVEFPQELRCLLVQLLQAEARRRDEEERLKHTMRNLGSVGESQAIIAVFQTICRASTISDLPILIRG
jgi:hypothetical protein